jgi:hypothetical protein
MDALLDRGLEDRAHRTAHGVTIHRTRHQAFPMRREQAEAVNRTHAYFHSIWKEDMHAVPRFLWNAKMRFAKLSPPTS